MKRRLTGICALIIGLMLLMCGCGKNTLADKDYETVGEGELYLSANDKTTEKGETPLLDKDNARIGIEVRNIDNSVETYIYIDGKKFRTFQDTEDATAHYSGAVLKDASQIEAGTHRVEVVQYDDKDEITFYRAAEYKVKK